jgi:hypothetical protein
MKTNSLLLFCVILSFISTPLSAQVLIPLPEPPTLQPNIITGVSNATLPPPITAHSYDPSRSKNEQNYRMVEEDMRQVQLQEQRNRQLSAISSDNRITRDKQGNIVLPDFRGEPGSAVFFSAFDLLHQMLKGETPINYKKAVFTVENTYYGNTLDYKKFNSQITHLVQLCRMKIRQRGLSGNDDMVKKMMIMNAMIDTLRIKQTGTEKQLIHFPMKYDFEDIFGEKDASKLFVTKLLQTNTGQCHSLPLLYLILAEEMGTKAYLSRSPMHSFIKFQDDKRNWHNIELTCGGIFSDYRYMSYEFIKAEAVRHKIYMQPLTEKETIAQLMTDLASVYIRKHGYDGFVKQCVETALKYYPNCVSAYIINSNYHTERAMYVIEREGYPSKEDLPKHPQAYKMYLQMHKSYDDLFALGYEDVPETVYQNWLKEMEKEKQKPEYKVTNRLHETIK